jgi:tetratricopeptide (TPR) repeat protein
LAQRAGIQSSGSFSLVNRLGNALVACVVYLGQMVWPAGLAVLYPFPSKGLPSGEIALAAILLAGISAAAWAGWRTRPWLLFGWVWYLVMLLPVMGLIQVGGQAHADRYTYLPQIGIYVAVTWLVADWRLSRTAFGALMTGVLAVLIFCAWRQTAYWQNSETLWTRDLSCTTANDVAQNGLATALLRKGRAAEALSHYEEALRIEPLNARAQNNLAWLLATCPDASLRNGAKAVELARQANELSGGTDPSMLDTMGAAFAEAGRFKDATQTVQKAIELSRAAGRQDLVEELEGELKRYEAGLPCRQ